MTDAELNAAIATEVMGWTPWPSEHDVHGWVLPGETVVGPSLDHWKPATDIADAFEVVERMREKPEHVFDAFARALTAYGWRQRTAEHAGVHDAYLVLMFMTPRAICEAALSAGSTA